MRPTKVRLHLLSFFVLAVAATGAIAGCLDDGGPSLNPQPLPPQSPDEERRGGDVSKSPPGESENPSGGGNSGASSSSSGSSGSSAVEGDGGADAGR